MHRWIFRFNIAGVSLVFLGAVLSVVLQWQDSRLNVADSLALSATAFESEEFTEDVIDPLYSHGLYSKELYDDAYAGVESVENVEIVEDVESAIVAHHMLVADKIAEVFAAIGNDETKTVVILSPNHFSVGESAAQVSVEAWDTPYGYVATDLAAVERLLADVEFLDHEEWAFQNEHGIAALTPFIKRSFPRAKIVPIILNEALPAAEARELGTHIANSLPNAVVIASVDMSHFLPRHAQNYHDAVTRQIIANGEGDIDLEIDSNASLRALFAFNKEKAAQVWNETHHGSSLDMVDLDDFRGNTGHILGYFTKGVSEPEKYASLHIVGDIMLDRGVRKQIDAAGTVVYPWQEVGRYLDGSHLTIGNLEGTVNEQRSSYTYNPPFRFVFTPEMVEEMGKHIDAVSLANNHARDVGRAGEEESRERLDGMGIPWFGAWGEPTPRYDVAIGGFDLTFIGYHQFHPNEQMLRDEISLADREGRFVIVMPHWGNEYINAPQANQRRLAEIMVEAGADLIIGGHPHVPQGIQVVGGVPVVYSLGNFVFDQEIRSTWNAFTAGIELREESITIHLMPIYTRYGKPTPLSGPEAQKVLDLVAQNSDEVLRMQILEGALTIERQNNASPDVQN